MVGLLIILGLGLFVLLSLLYATRLDDNHDLAAEAEPHPGYRFSPDVRTGLGLPLTTRSPIDLVFASERDAAKELERASHGDHQDAENAETDEDGAPQT